MALQYFSRFVLGTIKPIYAGGELAEFQPAGDNIHLLIVDDEKSPRMAEILNHLKGTKGIDRHTKEAFEELKKKSNDVRALAHLKTPQFKQLFKIDSARQRPQVLNDRVVAHVAVNPPPLDIPDAEAPVGHPLHVPKPEAVVADPAPAPKRRARRTLRLTDDPVLGSVRAAPIESLATA
jgi:hypothetical protein